MWELERRKPVQWDYKADAGREREREGAFVRVPRILLCRELRK